VPATAIAMMQLLKLTCTSEDPSDFLGEEMFYIVVGTTGL
jgi:hypothetical protein